MNRRDYLRALLGTLGTVACGGEGLPDELGSDERRLVEVPPPAPISAASWLDVMVPAVKVVTDFAHLVEARGTARENWGPAFEAAWNDAAAMGTDVFVPTGIYRVRLRERRGGYGPALDLKQPAKYRPVRMIAPTRGAEVRVEEWPDGAPRDQEVIRVSTAVRSASGDQDVATGTEVANLSVVNASASARGPAWNTPFDYSGVGIRMVGIYGGAVTGCFFRGWSTGLVMGRERDGETSYLCSIARNRFQGCNQAIRLPATANGHAIRENLVLWLNAPRSGPVGAFETHHSTTSMFFTENSAEQCAGWIYDIGATTNARIFGGRMESIHGAVRVRGTGNFPARGTQIEGLSVDCDSLHHPAIWLQRSAGALLSGITFYQSRTDHPHLMLGEGTENTTILALGSTADAELRVVDRSRGLAWVGARP